MKYLIDPVPKPRMTRADAWKKRPCVTRYYAFKDMVRLLRIHLPTEGAAVYFHIPMPKSWSKKKKRQMHGTIHRQKPDLSNLLKALEDAIYQDDSAIGHYAGLGKYWSHEGAIVIIAGCKTVNQLN